MPSKKKQIKKLSAENVDLCDEVNELRDEIKRIKAQADERINEANALIAKSAATMHLIFDAINSQLHDLDVAAVELKKYLR